MRAWTDDPAHVRPMLATTGDAPLDSPELVYEPKYDGIRAIASVGPAAPARLWSRLGNEKTAQFPEIVDALTTWARHLDQPVVLDGEIVALDSNGAPCGFQNLQGRIHLKSPPARQDSAASKRDAKRRPSIAFIVFDLLRDGEADLRPLPLRDRRARLEPLFRQSSRSQADAHLRLSDQARGDGRALHARACDHGWEGLIAKRADSAYASGRRSPEWRKLKLVRHQSCVVGGWTEPRGSRPFFGALLLGVYDEDGQLHYIGHTGAGFTDAELGRVWKRLQALKARSSPFTTTPRTNERPHWVKPELVAEVKFTEWTADRRLRHPTYLGLRDDVKPQTVRREPQSHGAETRVDRSRHSHGERNYGRGSAAPRISSLGRRIPARNEAADRPAGPTRPAITKLLDQLTDIEERGGDGTLELPGGARLEVTNLRKVFWPKLKLTKGDLLRHYVRVARVILPVLADRPLVLKRYPNGIDAKPFYQHRAPVKFPAGIRVEAVATDSAPRPRSGHPAHESQGERRPHFVGGDLATLLYTAQLASISQDPWFSRVQSQDLIDHVAIDLDPPDDLPFARVLEVAQWVRDELDALGAPGFPKTSGSGGLHVYVPMPPGTPYEAGLLYCQIVAARVAAKHPKVATVERAVAARGRRIYVDCLQNIQGKTLASAYSARANAFAGVSTPLTWEDVEEGVSPKDFTIQNFGDRLTQVGDLWAGLRKAKGADLRAVT
jgi:bifunctional non-homologous end joining protein LigD